MKQDLVKGFVATRWADGFNERFETLYAVKDDGKVYRSDEHKYSHSFDGPWAWHETDMTQDDVLAVAEFCGNYVVSKLA